MFIGAYYSRTRCMAHLLRTTKMIKKPFYFIAGPCAVESEDQFKKTLKYVLESGVKYVRVGAYKPRTSPDSFQGLGKAAFHFISKLKNKYDFQIVSEIVGESDFKDMETHVDIFQVGARNMFNYSLLKFLQRNTEKKILFKRSFSATIPEYLNAAKYLENKKKDNLILCLRGIRTFEQIGSSLRYTPDLGSILEVKKMTHYPVIFDPSHATGVSEFVAPAALAALAIGADGLMIETTSSPCDALCDGKQSLDKKQFKHLVTGVKKYVKHF